MDIVIEEIDKSIKKKKNVKVLVSFISTFLLLVVMFFVAVNIGSLKVSVSKLVRGLFVEYDEVVSTIYDLRFPRIIISMLAGAGISVSGVLFQAVLKNPLADPGIVGISSGAGCVSALVISLAPSMYFYTPIFAFLGGVMAFTIVYGLSWNNGLSPLRIILVGVAINSMFTGLLDTFNSMNGGNVSGVASIINGNITMKTWDDVYTLLPYVVIGIVLALAFGKICNLLSLEDTTAKGLGINVNLMRILISLIAVLLASISTAVVGMVSFLGLIVPHIGRMLVGSDHKKLIPFSILLGAFVFLLADTLGRTIAMPYEVSASVIMSVIGGPFFIILLRRVKKYGK